MRIFWDTNLSIHLWENSPIRAGVEAVIAWQHSRAVEVMTSTLTSGEVLVQPMGKGATILLFNTPLLSPICT